MGRAGAAGTEERGAGSVRGSTGLEKGLEAESRHPVQRRTEGGSVFTTNPRQCSGFPPADADAQTLLSMAALC